MSTEIPLTDEVIADLKRKHGKHLMSFALERGGQEFVVKCPDGSEFERAMDKIHDGKKFEAITEVGEACLVFPDREAVRRHASERPGLIYNAGNKALELAGAADDVGAKKL